MEEEVSIKQTTEKGNIIISDVLIQYILSPQLSNISVYHRFTCCY